jgi:hypothetical protein
MPYRPNIAGGMSRAAKAEEGILLKTTEKG